MYRAAQAASAGTGGPAVQGYVVVREEFGSGWPKRAHAYVDEQVPDRHRRAKSVNERTLPIEAGCGCLHSSNGW
jgi:hypothetical protein